MQAATVHAPSAHLPAHLNPHIRITFVFSSMRVTVSVDRYMVHELLKRNQPDPAQFGGFRLQHHWRLLYVPRGATHMLMWVVGADGWMWVHIWRLSQPCGSFCLAVSHSLCVCCACGQGSSKVAFCAELCALYYLSAHLSVTAPKPPLFCSALASEFLLFTAASAGKRMDFAGSEL